MTSAAPTAAAPNAAPAVSALPAPIWGDAVVSIEDFGDPGSIMIHSEPGKGKTLTGAGIIKVPGIRNLCILDIDNGTESLLNDPEVMQAYRDGRITIIRVDKTDPNAFGNFHNYFWSVINHPFDKRGEPFDAFMIDTLDVAQECAVKYYKATTLNDTGTALDTRKAYGVIADWTGDVLWALQNHRQMTGITLVHTKADEDKKTKVSTLKPKFQGSIKDNAAGIPSLVAYLTKETDDDGVVHVLADMSGADEVVSKQRYSSFLPDRIVDFTLPKVYEMIRGGSAAISSADAAVTPINTHTIPALPVVPAA